MAIGVTIAPTNAPIIPRDVTFRSKLSVKKGKAPATSPLAAIMPPTAAHTAVVTIVGIPNFFQAKALFGAIFFIL